ncbi:ExbD/TolR family protein [Limisphaera sp. VF-2]|jgi:biopolymer transport protein ExbD|uniref:ExbD/TolR family protein n=1 Tax=Limisphaera sp. VF-2 TaxID=3400418 RepID=UPI001762C117|nr:biopolymer transporter ExbD [Limisphaera sp.]
MRFYVKSRRQTPTVIIVALIDVLIVLIIFLMVTTTFKQQPAVRLALPESTQAQRPGVQEDAPLVIAVDAEGRLWWGTETLPVTAESLVPRLKEEAARRPNLRLALSADEKAPFGQIIKVMDAAKEAGVRTVSAFAREPGRR